MIEEKEDKPTKEYRVIFLLGSGKRKYATHNGKVLLWDEEDIKSLKLNFIKYEQFAMTEDMEHFAFSADELAQRFPWAKIIRIKGIRTEDAEMPLNSKVIL